MYLIGWTKTPDGSGWYAERYTNKRGVTFHNPNYYFGIDSSWLWPRKDHSDVAGPFQTRQECESWTDNDTDTRHDKK